MRLVYECHEIATCYCSFIDINNLRNYIKNNINEENMKSIEGIIDTNKSKNDSIRNFSKLMGNVLFAFLIIIGTLISAYILGQKFLPNKLSPISSYKMFIVLSGSMSPEFNAGSVVYVKDIAPADVQVGDILTFRASTTSQNVVTHRVVKVDKENELLLTTQGDANNTEDPEKLHPENIIGKVHFSIPFIGYLLNFAKTKMGLYFLVVLPGILIILYEVFKIFWLLLNRNKKEIASVLAIKEDKNIPLVQQAARKYAEDIVTIDIQENLHPAKTHKNLTTIEDITLALKDVHCEIKKALNETDEKSFYSVLDEDIKLKNYRNKLELILDQY